MCFYDVVFKTPEVPELSMALTMCIALRRNNASPHKIPYDDALITASIPKYP